MRLFLFLVCLLYVFTRLEARHKIPNPNSLFNMESAGRGEVKTQWDELLATDADAALKKIQQERPGLKVVKVKKGSMVTMDFSLERVRVYYDPESGQVSSIPTVG
jgi:hypothetical protein